ncbi:MAG: TAT-variant-translocated molybdopterin oxidoreductase [Polyangiaceae bacterium]|nr:TAT-variant-translocated molybdopterin oxidoreductase [Polyangiaceae bacterium]
MTRPDGETASFEPQSVRTRFWRTLEERTETPGARAAAEDEFLPETVGDSLAPTILTRRGFLGMVGAAAAIAACTPRERTIVPYTKRPEEVIPGVANYYATTFPEGERSYSVLVKTREGRPLHITGNDEHPRLRGKTTLRAIADIMGLYDDGRLRRPSYRGRPSTWPEADKALAAAVAEASDQSKPLLLLTGASGSPTRAALLAELGRRVPALEHRVWEPSRGGGMLSAAQAAFGTNVCVRLRLERTKVVVSVGADFLAGDDPEAAAAFTAQRRPREPVSDMPRLWAFEGPLSVTGSNADHRFPIRPSQAASLVFALAAALHASYGFALPPGVVLAPPESDCAARSGISADLWQALLTDLSDAKESAVVLCGDSMPEQAHVAAHLLNAILHSRGIELAPAPPVLSAVELAGVVEQMEEGRYHAVVFWGTNPAYAFPNAQRLRAALSRVPHRFWIGQCIDETAEICSWRLPENHWLESWGDHGSPELLTLQQPAVGCLYDTRQGEDMLIALLKGLGTTGLTNYHEYLLDRWRREVYSEGIPVPFERYMHAALHDGVLARELASAAALELRADAVNRASSTVAAARAAPGFELVLAPSTQLLDGRYANNPWLQELPDPITKNTWGNPLLVSVADANHLGLENGDRVRLTVAGQSVETPVIVQPGQASGVLSLSLGYGRKVGLLGRKVGSNAYPLLGADASSHNLRTGAKLAKLGTHVRMPLTQRHHRMHGRDLVRSRTLAQYAEESAQPPKKVALPTLYPDQRFPAHKWGMVVDLAACVGCSACVLACQSENNIATVGPEQVERGREMHWIRIDTYYEGSADNPCVVHQPMMCQQCDSAPCENVCPVNATNHSPDGLNQMAYNRCVGTRYCANNCPYKVRRFNFFNYTAEKKEPENLVFNPEVTVRPRGVMEKCTFCVQRIADARMRAKVEKRTMRDGDVVPACAAACPTSAIVFGDLNDPNSRVARASRNRRGYKVLEELGIRPAVTYLAALRNPSERGGARG